MDGGIEVDGKNGIAMVRLGASKAGQLDAAAVRALLADLDRIAAGPDPAGLILAGTQGTMSQGADYADLVAHDLVHDLFDIAERLAALTYPVVAAVEGTCAGPVAELILAADGRVAHPRVKVGFGDIAIGLPPVAGATLRLPHLVGPENALKTLLSGKSVMAEGGRAAGLFDEIDEDPIRAAEALALRIAETPRRRADGGAILAAAARHKAAAERVPIEAPRRIIECIEAAVLLPPEIYRNMQEIAFDDLWSSDEARALAHIDRAERRAARLQRMVKPKARPVERVAVAGARGTAQGVAVSALKAGFDVTMTDPDDEALESGVVRVIEHVDAAVAAGTLSEEDAETRLDRLHAVSGYQTLSSADIVFDIVNARGAASRSLIAQLDEVMKAGAILATGSTQVGPDTIGAITTRPSDVVSARFFGPIGERRAVEVAPGRNSAPVALGTVVSVLTRMDRLPIVLAPGARGAGARLMAALHAVADHLLEQGASVTLIDSTLKSWGLANGSFAERDARGIVAPSPRTQDPATTTGLDGTLAGLGLKGVSTGQGYYLHEGAAPVVNPGIDRLLADVRDRKGITLRTVAPSEIRLSAIAAMANAGAMVMAEGAVSRPDQVDLLSVHGLGLSRRAGGVMQAADLAGLGRVRARLKALHAENEGLPGPAPIFAKLLDEGRTFADLNAD